MRTNKNDCAACVLLSLLPAYALLVLLFWWLVRGLHPPLVVLCAPSPLGLFSIDHPRTTESTVVAGSQARTMPHVTGEKSNNGRAGKAAWRTFASDGMHPDVRAPVSAARRLICSISRSISLGGSLLSLVLRCPAACSLL